MKHLKYSLTVAIALFVVLEANSAYADCTSRRNVFGGQDISCDDGTTAFAVMFLVVKTTTMDGQLALMFLVGAILVTARAAGKMSLAGKTLIMALRADQMFLAEWIAARRQTRIQHPNYGVIHGYKIQSR
jgi:hypothetical protein